MNRNTLFLIAVIATLTVASCTRCKKCSYTYKYNGVDSTKTLLQTCGNAKELNTYENSVKAEAARNNATTDVTCEKVKL